MFFGIFFVLGALLLLIVKTVSFLKPERVKFFPMAIFFYLYGGLSHILYVDLGMSVSKSGYCGFVLAGFGCLLTYKILVPYLLKG